MLLFCSSEQHNHSLRSRIIFCKCLLYFVYSGQKPWVIILTRKSACGNSKKLNAGVSPRGLIQRPQYVRAGGTLWTHLSNLFIVQKGVVAIWPKSPSAVDISRIRTQNPFSSSTVIPSFVSKWTYLLASKSKPGSPTAYIALLRNLCWFADCPSLQSRSIS